MEVLKFTEVPNLVLIIEKLLTQKSKGRPVSRESEDETMHFTIDETGEFVIYDVKNEQGDTYIIELSEAKNGHGGKCYISIYSADIRNIYAEEFSRELFENEERLKAIANAARFAVSVKKSLDIGETIWGPLFSRRIIKNNGSAYDK